MVLSEALRSAKIDIIGGDGQFFDQISAAVQGGKTIDRFVLSSKVATDIKDTFFSGNPEQFKERLGGLLKQFQLDSSDIKDLSVAALIAKLLSTGGTDGVRSQLVQLLGLAGTLNLADKQVVKVID